MVDGGVAVRFVIRDTAEEEGIVACVGMQRAYGGCGVGFEEGPARGEAAGFEAAIL